MEKLICVLMILNKWIGTKNDIPHYNQKKTNAYD